MNETWWVNPSELDDDQKEIIALPLEGSYLVKGPPGSGKTNLLLLRASHIARSGLPDIAILVFTRTLREFLASGGGNYAFSDDKVMTSMLWMRKFIREFDGKVPRCSDFTEQRQSLIREIKKILDNGEIPCQHEAILLDEAQDYLPEEIEIFQRLSNRIFAVADSRQKIYDEDSPIEKLEEISDQTHCLRFHYRTGLNICKLADGIGCKWTDYVPMSPFSNYNESAMPSQIEVILCADIDEQCKKISEQLDNQLKAYPDEYIGIICPRQKEFDKVAAFFTQSSFASKASMQDGENGHIIFHNDKPIIITKMHSAKGLEFRALHIVGFENIRKHGSTQKKISFMGVTRAKTSLSIYHSNKLPGYFAQAYANMQRPPEIPKIEDLFKAE